MHCNTLFLSAAPTPIVIFLLFLDAFLCEETSDSGAFRCGRLDPATIHLPVLFLGARGCGQLGDLSRKLSATSAFVPHFHSDFEANGATDEIPTETDGAFRRPEGSVSGTQCRQCDCRLLPSRESPTFGLAQVHSPSPHPPLLRPITASALTPNLQSLALVFSFKSSPQGPSWNI